MAIGERIPRREDRRLLTGTARFVDDLDASDALEVAFLRSPEAHGELRRVSVSDAVQLAGVEAVLTSEDLALPPIQSPTTNPDVTIPPQPVLATERVRFAGEPIALVVATTRYRAEDAVDAIRVEIDPLPALLDPGDAVAPDAPAIHAGIDNAVVDTTQDHGDVDAALAAAAFVIETRLESPRHSAIPIEARAVLACPDGERIGVWSSSQSPHKVAQLIAELLGLEPDAVRVVTPDVGGGFGLKAHVYPEDIAIAAAALRVGRPLRWVEDRSENLIAATHARDQSIQVRAGVDDRGRLLAFDVDMLCDQGAYGAYPHGVSLEALSTSGMIPGPYRLRNYRVRARAAVTNKSPQGAYRGVGFVVSTFVHERVMDLLAAEAGLDRAEIRRRNLLRADELPYVSITNQPYDSGDYVRAFELALERIGYQDARPEPTPNGHRRRGIGIACYVEPTGMNSKVFAGRGMVGIAGYDGAHVALETDGTVRVWTTTPAIGQGSETTLAQLVADSLRIEPGRITVEHSDTGVGDLEGTGTFASRSAVSSGGAVVGACATLRRRLVEDAAERLEAAEDDLVVEGGEVSVVGSPGASIKVGALAAANPDRYRLSHCFDPPQTVYPYATHACVVEVDTETGEVAVVRYVVVEDCGRIINPIIVEGQVHGAVAQGIGGALFEGHDYDEEGQLRTASLLDYLIPTAAELPELELVHLELPSPVTSTGVKGVGEGGTLAPAPALAGAVSDAVGAQLNGFPITPEQVLAALADR